MSSMTVYVFHPDRGEKDDEVSASVQGELSRFLHENRDEEFWFDCIGAWRLRFGHSGESDFRTFLLSERFREVDPLLFDEPGDPATLLELNACDVAGFFVARRKTGQPEKVWQLLNPLGRFDRILPDNLYSSKPLCLKPLRTKSGREVQSCLTAHLDREKTSAPGVYVYGGEWIAEGWLDPITGEQRGWTKDQLNGTTFEETFWDEVETFSPNTRVTAVECHY